MGLGYTGRTIHNNRLAHRPQHYILWRSNIIVFHRDLEAGKIVERQHLGLIQRKWSDAYLVDGYCKEWDIFIPSQNIGVEIKSDQKSQYTGNIVVEIQFNGRPSALSTTRAKYWIFYTGKKSIVVEVDKLKELVKRFKPVQFIGKGDTKQKIAYLIPQRFIEDLHNNDLESY